VTALAVVASTTPSSSTDSASPREEPSPRRRHSHQHLVVSDRRHTETATACESLAQLAGRGLQLWATTSSHSASLSTVCLLSSKPDSFPTVLTAGSGFFVLTLTPRRFDSSTLRHSTLRSSDSSSPLSKRLARFVEHEHSYHASAFPNPVPHSFPHPRSNSTATSSK
jgi:hypothetical protein